MKSDSFIGDFKTIILNLSITLNEIPTFAQNEIKIDVTMHYVDWKFE